MCTGLAPFHPDVACLHFAQDVLAGDTLHLLHVVPEPSMIHVWPGMYVPPDDDAEQDEVRLR